MTTTTTKTHKYFIYHSEMPLVPSEWQYINYTKISKIKKAKEIFLFDLLDFIDTMQQKSLLENIKNCLANDGIIHIQAADIHSISSAILNNQIDIETYNNLIFSPSRTRINSMGRMITLLKEVGFSILEAKFINGVQYSLRCGKPNE